MLFADDEPGITENMAPLLERAGFDVLIAAAGEAALALIERHSPDVCILDVLMPMLDGREVVRRLRRSERWAPILLLTEVSGSGERAMAIEEGADDYMNKPFDPHELVARVRAQVRCADSGRRSLGTSSDLVAADLRLDRVSRRAFLGDGEIGLTPKAFNVLEYLVVHPDELLSRERLLESVWGWDNPVGTRAVDHRIAELRRQLGDDAGEPTYIGTVAGWATGSLPGSGGADRCRASQSWRSSPRCWWSAES